MKNIILIFSFLTLLVFSNKLNAQCTNDTHSANEQDAWLSCTLATNPNPSRGNSHWIQYDLGTTYVLSTSHVWNYNVAGNTARGFKDVAIDYSTNGTTWTTLGNFQFQQATGNSNYTGFDGPDFEAISARYVLITALNDWGGDGCLGLSEMRINVLPRSCDTPINVQAIVVSGNTVKLSWNAMEGAEKYKFHYRVQGTSSWTERLPNTNLFFLNNLTPNTTYEYKVKTLCTDDASVWSSIKTFTTLSDLCDVPTLYNATEITSNSSKVSWSSKTDDVKYKLAFKQAGTSSWSFLYPTIDNLTLTALLANTKYKYKVKTKCASNIWTNWSTKKDFTTTSSLARLSDNNGGDPKQQWNIQVYPNPTTNFININYGNMPISSAYITTANGLIIREMIGDEILEQIGVRELADGLYFFVCQTVEGERVIKRFTKIH